MHIFTSPLGRRQEVQCSAAQDSIAQQNEWNVCRLSGLSHRTDGLPCRLAWGEGGSCGDDCVFGGDICVTDGLLFKSVGEVRLLWRPFALGGSRNRRTIVYGGWGRQTTVVIVVVHITDGSRFMMLLRVRLLWRHCVGWSMIHIVCEKERRVEK